MINLIYIILIAILAIHISRDAIEGYDIISNDYRPQIAQLQTYNEELRVRLEQEKPERRKKQNGFLRITIIIGSQSEKIR